MKFGSLKRNYESVSSYAAKDNMEQKKVKDIIDALKRENDAFKHQNNTLAMEHKALSEQNEFLNSKCRDQVKLIEKSETTIEQLKKDLARKDKQFEDKIKLERNAARSLTDQNAKYKAENNELKRQLETAKKENDELLRQLENASDSLNTINRLQVQLSDRQKEIELLSGKNTMLFQ